MNPLEQTNGEDSTDFERPTGWNPIWLYLPFVIVILGGIGWFVFSTLSREKMPDLTAEIFEAAEARWQAQGPKSYAMEIELQGATPGHVEIEVQDHVVTKMERDGKIPDQRTWDTWSVPGIFDFIDREFELAKDPTDEIGAAEGTQLLLRGSFDPKDGHPTGFQRAVLGGNAPEVYWRVTRFEAK